MTKFVKYKCFFLVVLFLFLFWFEKILIYVADEGRNGEINLHEVEWILNKHSYLQINFILQCITTFPEWSSNVPSVLVWRCKLHTLKQMGHELTWPYDSGRLQESACVLFWKSEQAAGSDSAPSVEFGEFCVLVNPQSWCDSAWCDLSPYSIAPFPRKKGGNVDDVSACVIKWLKLWTQSVRLYLVTFYLYPLSNSDICSRVNNAHKLRSEASRSSGVGWSWGRQRKKELTMQSVVTTSVNYMMTSPPSIPTNCPSALELCHRARSSDSKWTHAVLNENSLTDHVIVCVQ